MAVEWKEKDMLGLLILLQIKKIWKYDVNMYSSPLSQ